MDDDKLEWMFRRIWKVAPENVREDLRRLGKIVEAIYAPAVKEQLAQLSVLERLLKDKFNNESQ